MTAPSGTPRRESVRQPRAGFTLIELLMVVIVVGVMMAVAVPKFRISPETEVQLAAMQLAQDIDLARTRALSTRSLVRVQFGASARDYTGYLDIDNDGTIGGTSTEREALRGFATQCRTDSERCQQLGDHVLRIAGGLRFARPDVSDGQQRGDLRPA